MKLAQLQKKKHVFMRNAICKYFVIRSITKYIYIRNYMGVCFQRSQWPLPNCVHFNALCPYSTSVWHFSPRSSFACTAVLSAGCLLWNAVLGRMVSTSKVHYCKLYESNMYVGNPFESITFQYSRTPFF